MEKSEIKQVLVDQQDELKALYSELQARGLQKELSKLLSSRQIKVVIGIRRSGKSSLCLKVARDVHIGYVNFDDERFLGLATKDLNRILEVLLEIHPEVKVFLFDEIQNVEGWELFINRLARQKYNILITGSSGKLLSGELSTHLTGRHISFTLFPLSFVEYLWWQSQEQIQTVNYFSTSQRSSLAKHFDWFFQNGGFPQVVQGESPGPYLRSLFDNIISRDIVQRYNLRTSKAIKDLASYLIQNSGQVISIKKLKDAFGISSVSMVQKYLEYLEDCFLIFELRTYSFKLKERSNASRKIYACDTGMMKALWTKPTEDLGSRFETLVFLELIKAGAEIYMLKEGGYEVDFCIVNKRKIEIMIQVCYSIKDPQTREREILPFIKLAKKYRTQKLMIITWETRETIHQEGLQIECWPANEFILTLTALLTS